MSEKPILFSGPMVRAILDGSKTQTRRVVKAPDWFEGHKIGFKTYDESLPLKDRMGLYNEVICSRDGDDQKCCPYGNAFDRLWVRETFTEGEGVVYRADWDADFPYISLKGLWKPSIFMPRRLCRIVLEVTGVTVERLNDISRGDAMQEGCPFSNMQVGPDPRQWFCGLWESINGPNSWRKNPWVWVVRFRRLP